MARLTVFAILLLAGTVCSSPSRIVGGSVASLEKWPFIVAVELFSRNFGGSWNQRCAGNILTRRYVMSVAHCFSGPASNRRVRAGSLFRNTGGIVYTVQSYLNHPSYGQGLGLDGDINLVRLSSLIIFGPTVTSGVIPRQNAIVLNGVPVWHAGWGATSQGGSQSPELLETRIYTINNDYCRQLYAGLRPTPAIITPNMICAAHPRGGHGACQGDSGGPLTYGGIIVGVISGGHGCANETYPGVSTSVASYTDWIVANAV